MEAKSSVYALNECGVLISKGLSLLYNKQGLCGPQIPSCTTSKDLEKQWLIAAWEIHMYWSFKFFGGVSRSHCDQSDHSPLHIHLYVFTTSSPSTLKVSQIYIYLLYKFECSPQTILSSDCPIVQSSKLPTHFKWGDWISPSFSHHISSCHNAFKPQSFKAFPWDFWSFRSSPCLPDLCSPNIWM